MRCPNCSLENPPTAQRCDCGFDFLSRQMKESYVTGRAGSTKNGNPPIIETFYGKFRKVRMKPFKAYGNYRGEGRIEFTGDGLRICGRHVMSMGARWGIGLALFFGLLVLTMGTFAPGVIPLYLILEYVWLKREDTTVPFCNVIGYASDPKRSLVGIDFHGPEWCRPVVLKSERWQELAAMLRQKMPDRDAPAIVISPLGKGRAR